MKVRRMYLEDIDKVMEIEPKVFGSHHWTRNNFVKELDNKVATYFVAEKEGELVAYSGLWIVAEETHITTLAVDPRHRRQGIAEGLLIAMIDFAIKGAARAITLEVRLSNTPAQNLYEKYGFQRLGIRRNYYEDNREAALLLWTEDLNSKSFQDLYNKNVNKYKGRSSLTLAL